MSENSKKIFITTKTSELFIIRRGQRKAIRGFCGECQSEVELLTLDEAVCDSGARTRELIRLSDEGKIHSIETIEGHILICSLSLKNSSSSDV